MGNDDLCSFLFGPFSIKDYAKELNELRSDMAIILGGDGTLLRTQNQLTKEIPIFGINMGTVGFLTEIEAKHAFYALDDILKGDYYKEKRKENKLWNMQVKA